MAREQIRRSGVPLLVVPACLRKELMAVIHRAQDTLYWPRMATALREYIFKCDICLAHRAGQAKEPLLQHEVVARPWSKVCTDLCEPDNRTLLIICDYYSNFIKVARLNSVTSRSIIKEMKSVFARYGNYQMCLSLIMGLSSHPPNLLCLQRPECFSTPHPFSTIHSQMEGQRMR